VPIGLGPPIGPLANGSYISDGYIRRRMATRASERQRPMRNALAYGRCSTHQNRNRACVHLAEILWTRPMRHSMQRRSASRGCSFTGRVCANLPTPVGMKRKRPYLASASESEFFSASARCVGYPQAAFALVAFGSSRPAITCLRPDKFLIHSVVRRLSPRLGPGSLQERRSQRSLCHANLHLHYPRRSLG
jgi:hypothetical protein